MAFELPPGSLGSGSNSEFTPPLHDSKQPAASGALGPGQARAVWSPVLLFLIKKFNENFFTVKKNFFFLLLRRS